MDYEKKYKEALERAKKLIDEDGLTEGSYPNKKACEAIFPELAESEDERIRNDIMEAVENWCSYERVEEIRSYLEKQKEQKQVEWSEEDERNINTLISVIKAHYNEFDLVRDDYPINARGLGAWLKSIRPQPHWKPSGEQMKALEEVRTIFHHHHLWDEINPILYDYEELMRDLQKLL